MKFEVTYSLFDDRSSGSWSSHGSTSQYTTTVEAMHQGAAEQMVESMNGGRNRCLIRSCRSIF